LGAVVEQHNEHAISVKVIPWGDEEEKIIRLCRYAPVRFYAYGTDSKGRSTKIVEYRGSKRSRKHWCGYSDESMFGWHSTVPYKEGYEED
jgi:hypothetical protein